MNKKILLSTILASSVLAGNQAMAGIIAYNNNVANQNGYTFTITSSTSDPTLINKPPYASITALGVDIASAFFINGESFELDPASEPLFEKDLLGQVGNARKQTLVTDIANGISQKTGATFTANQLDGILDSLKILQEHGLAPFEEIEFTDLLEIRAKDLPKLLAIDAFIQNVATTVENVVAFVDANQTVVNQLATTNSDVSDALNTIANLQAAVSAKTATAGQYFAFYEAKFEIADALKATNEGKAALRTAQSQENFKNALSAAENLKTTNKETLKAGIDTYLLDPNTTSNKDLTASQKSDAHTTSGIMSASLASAGVLADRISGFVGQGVSSGDIFQTYGAWVKGIMGVGEQKAFNKESGYKFNQRGATIGVDTGDESMIGAAFTILKNDITNKDSSSTKDKMDTMIGSIYGMYAATQEVFVSGQFSYGKSKIKKSRNTGDLANNKATAKPSGTNLGGRAEVGYVYAIDDATQVVPSIGFAMNKVDVKGYTEKGDGINRTVGKRTSSRNSGLVGVALKHTAQMESMKVMPEIHANLDYAFSGKNSATNISFANGLLTTSTPSEKISKAYFNIGGSVKFAASEAFDVTAGYDMGLAKKFMSHTGALKLRVNF
jgi:hypothetical protein